MLEADLDEEGDVPQLSAEALAALKEFYAEHAAKGRDSSKDSIEEDWLSQFWYDDTTATHLAQKALEAAGSEGKIACISCPSVYQVLRKLKPDSCTAKLLEYDRRFQVYGSDFIAYDYNDPLEIPGELRGSCDIVLADPPFLSEECLTKTAVTIKFLAKGRIILCTGAVMEELAVKLLQVKRCKFEPRHSKNLANVFYCYANYNFDQENKLH